MLDEKTKKYIETVADQFNKDAYSHAIKVSRIIKQLQGFIDEEIELSKKRIEVLLDELVGFYTITLDIPLDSGTHIVRAVKFEEKESVIPCYEYVSRLSHIPSEESYKSKVGRLNKEKEVIFYGCLSDGKKQGISVAFAEIKVLEGELINVLKSITKEKIKVNYIGVFDHYKRGVPPPFEVHPNFELAYKYQESKFDNHLMIAYQLCDAFFSDILRTKKYGRLYEVTSVLASLFLEGRDSIDGIIYSSVQSEGDPVIALKTSTVTNKVEHIEAMSMVIEKDYGYAIYDAPTLFHGQIVNEKIKWTKV